MNGLDQFRIGLDSDLGLDILFNCGNDFVSDDVYTRVREVDSGEIDGFMSLGLTLSCNPNRGEV
jgi:hypothetical protein